MPERHLGMSKDDSLGGLPSATLTSPYNGLILQGTSKMTRRGFTVVEVLLVVVLIVTLVGMALPWIPGLIQAYRLRLTAWELAGNLRLARQKAVTTQVRHRVCFADCGTPIGSTAVPNPGYVVEREDGGLYSGNWQLDFSVDFAHEFVGSNVTFDDPPRSVTFHPKGTAGGQTITVANPSGEYSVVTAQTGRVRVCKGSC